MAVFITFPKFLGVLAPNWSMMRTMAASTSSGLSCAGKKREEDLKFLLFFAGEVPSAGFAEFSDGVPSLFGLAVNDRQEFGVAEGMFHLHLLMTHGRLQHTQRGQDRLLLTFDGFLKGLIQLFAERDHEPSSLRSFFKALFLAAKTFFLRLMLGFS